VILQFGLFRALTRWDLGEYTPNKLTLLSLSCRGPFQS